MMPRWPVLVFLWLLSAAIATAIGKALEHWLQ